MPARGKSYLLKNTTKARVKIGVVGSRAQLAYSDLTKASATGEITKLVRGTRQLATDAGTDGKALKQGLEGMARRLQVSDEQYYKIHNMDEQTLAKMYDSSDLTFEVFFNYEGVRKTELGYIISDDKKRDVDWFIEQYERVAKIA